MISVVIPCHNEEKGIQKVIPGLPSGSEILVVDNNSTDKTSQVASDLGARVIKESLPGYGSAIRAGLKQASQEIVVVLDGDGQYPGDRIAAAIEFLQNKNLDFVSWGRFPLTNPLAMSRTRVLGNWLLTLAANILFFLRLKDSQSGMWVFRRRVLDSVVFENTSMPFSEEIKIKVAQHSGLRFGEYHIPYEPRVGDSSLFPLKHGWQNLVYLLKLRFQLWFSRKKWQK